MKIKTTAFRNNYPAAIMILIILISSFTGSAQSLDGKFYQPIVPPYSWQSGWFKTNLNIPKSAATTGRDTGAIYYKLSDSSLYTWTGSQWRLVSGSGGGSQTLQQTTDLGNKTTNSIEVVNSGYLLRKSISTADSIITWSPVSNWKGFSWDMSKLGNSYDFKFDTTTTNRNYWLPDTSGVIPMAVKVNGTRYAPGATGLIDLGTISGGGALADADYGDITVSGTGTVMTINNGEVTNIMLADMPAHTFKGNNTGLSDVTLNLTIAEMQAELKIPDSLNTRITSVYRKTASDSVFYVKGGTPTFAFKDSIGAGGSADSSTFVTNTIMQHKIDSILRVVFPNGAGDNVKVFAGVLYPTWNGTTNDWAFYDGTSGHAVTGFLSANASGSSLVLSHNTVDSVVACIVGTDEQLQKYDITLGGSAGYSDVTIQGSIPQMRSQFFMLPDFTSANSFTLNLSPSAASIVYDTTTMTFQVNWSAFGAYALQQPHVYAGNYYGTEGVNNLLQRMPDQSTYVQKFKYPVDAATGYKKPKYLCTNDDNFWIDFTYREPLSFGGYQFPSNSNIWVIEIVIDK